MFSSTYTPRTMGEVSTPLAVTVMTAGMVSKPPRRVSSSFTFCKCSPTTFCL